MDPLTSLNAIVRGAPDGPHCWDAINGEEQITAKPRSTGPCLKFQGEADDDRHRAGNRRRS